MAISLGPGKFYGKSLPRPRIYTDVKFNDHRVDPPIPVTDPFMSWAEEAHWSMGGLSFTRLRFQGKIEGNVNKLRSQLEKVNKVKARAQSQSPVARPDRVGSKRAAAAAFASSPSSSSSPSPPAAPVAAKRRRLTSLIEEEKKKDEEESHVVTRGVQRRRLVKKLGEEFDRVASENEGGDEAGRVGSKLDFSKGSGDGSESDVVGPRIRRRRLMKGGEVVGKVVEDVKKKMNEKKSDDEKSPGSVSRNGVRASPRLAKRVNN
ncbi:hypothetical protein RIF29_05665 [Crotalaria pallida]|uniref:Uncharacterized protein n=1 Tax=Crotalaria pallida TaxID=3830 RepID=A0AAN9J3A7_CROPI